MSQGSNKRGVEERWREEGGGEGGDRKGKKGDLEKRVAFRNKLNERERKRKGGGVVVGGFRESKGEVERRRRG